MNGTLFDYSDNNANLSDNQIGYLKNARAEVVARIVVKFGNHVAAKVTQCLTHHYDFRFCSANDAYVYGPNNESAPYYTTKKGCSCPASYRLQEGELCKHSLALFAILETRRIAEENYARDLIAERPAF